VISKQAIVLLRAALFTSCPSTATEIPTITPEGTLSRAVETMHTYKLINDAWTEDDLTESWNIWTHNAQCYPREQCGLFRFQDGRWSSKVLYKLYECGSNRVVAEELRYPRKGDVPTAGEAQDWKYQLGEFDGVILISDVHIVSDPWDDWVLALN